MLLSLSGFHVLMTTDCVGGVFNHTMALARDWVNRGAAVIVATIGPAPQSGQISELTRCGAEWIVLEGALDWMAHSEDEIAQTTRNIETLAKQRHVDSIHLHTPSYAAFDMRLPHIAACHSCHATWWDTVHPGETMPADLAWRASLVKQGLIQADDVIAPSHAFACQLANTYQLVRTPIPIPNGSCPLTIESPQSRKGVVAAGRFWDEAKNLVGLNAIADGLQNDLVAIGPLPAIPHASFSPRLRTVGPLDHRDVLSSFADAQIFVSDALYEPFGLTALEAAQAGLALVLSDIPAHRENWDGVAIFREPNDHEGFSRSINQLLAHPEEAEERGQCARARANAFSAERMGETTALVHLHPRKRRIAA